jgi:signal transduction histidine kinase
MLRIVAERADHLARLVEDLLLASRISSETGGAAVVDMRRECTDLAEAARRAAVDWWRAPHSRLELELPDGPLEVDADPLRLVQVLANLVRLPIARRAEAGEDPAPPGATGPTTAHPR